MKVYAVTYKFPHKPFPLEEGEVIFIEPTTRLIKAESLAQARAHVMQIISARVATQEDLLTAIDGSTPVENIGVDGVSGCPEGRDGIPGFDDGEDD